MPDRQYFQTVPADELEKLINFSGAPIEYAQLQAGESAIRQNKKFYVIAVLWEVEPPTNSRPTPFAGDS